MNIIDIIAYWFSQSWRFFSELTIPVLNISFGTFFLGLFLMSLSIKIIKLLIGIISVQERDP